jgi:hypothetical protein
MTIIPKKLDRYIEPQLEKYDEKLNLTVSNNNVPKNDQTYSNMKEGSAESEQGSSNFQVKQDIHRQIQHKGLIPRGKRLTICTKCNKPGYKYQTYFQHYNEPPIGKVILKGKVTGDKCRRCYLTKQKEKKDNVKRNANSVPVQREKEKSRIGIKLKELGRYIEESRSSLSKEDDTGKDYKKMYLDLIENLRKIVDYTSRPTSI